MSRAILLLLVTLTGCTRSANLPATLVADDSDALFDTVAGVQFVRRTFNFTNVGDQRTTPLIVELRGDVDHFDIEWDGCSALALDGHATCQVVARLLPITDGSFDGELHVYGVAPVSASVLMHGKVMPASLSLTPMPSAAVDVVQGQHIELGVVVRNEGGVTTGPLRISESATPFNGRSANCDGVALLGGQSCTITLARDVPLDASLGTASGTIEVAATPGGVVEESPSLVVHAGGVLMVSSQDWGAIPTLANVERKISVTNPGPIETDPLATTIVDSSSYATFKIVSDGCAGKPLAVGATCQVTVMAYVSDSNQHSAALAVSASNVHAGNGMLTVTGKRAHWTMALSFAGSGSGRLDFSGSSLQGPTLETLFFSNGKTSPPLTPVANPGSTFTGWTGTAPCAGTTGVCAGFVGPDNGDLTLVANFSN